MPAAGSGFDLDQDPSGTADLIGVAFAEKHIIQLSFLGQPDQALLHANADAASILDAVDRPWLKRDEGSE